jgi:hypothetical protein
MNIDENLNNKDCANTEKQVVRATYTVECVWKVPTGIDLNDTETYDFGDKWGVLYIQNKNTGETIKIIKSFKLEQDFKHSNDLEVLSGADAEDFEDCFK